jgi:hypothetical protein
MKNNWRAMAASLAMLIGISGVAAAQPRQQQPVSNMRTAEYRVPERPQPQQPQRAPEARPQPRPVQQPVRTQVQPQRPDDNRNWGQERHVPVPVNRPVVNSYNNDRDHGRPDWNNGDRDHFRPVVVVNPVYTRPIFVAPAYVYLDAGFAAPVDYATTPQQAGFQDGLADGHNDWVMGYGFQNGFDQSYVNADNGFDPDFGSLQAYQSAYRIAYQQGYTQGYGR